MKTAISLKNVLNAAQFIMDISTSLNAVKLSINAIAATRKGIASKICLEKNFLMVPVNFYSPIPDLNDLQKRNILERKSGMFGINLNKKNQLSLLAKLGSEHGSECVWPVESKKNTANYYTNNGTFGGGCAAIAHCLIRHLKPARIIEIGSGRSSLIISEALKLNKNEGIKSFYTIIDPYPNINLFNNIKIDEFIKERVELLNSSIFNNLGANDILFIDSSHTSKIGSDVNYLILDVLPQLSDSVYIHFHDIRMPYEYTKRFAFKPVPQFWNEQYLLQAFLIYNNIYEITLALNYLMVNYKNTFESLFPETDLGAHPSSFWIKKLES